MIAERFIIVSDSHGEFQDDAAVSACLAFKKHWKPKFTVHLGDFIDVTSLRKGAGTIESNRGLKGDASACKEFMLQLKPDVVLFGNHDFRLMDAAKRSTDDKVIEYCKMVWEDLDAAIPNATKIPYGKRQGLNYGNFRLIHGYHAGIYAARMAAQVFDNVIQGHVHAVGTMPAGDLDGHVGHTIGCLARLDLDYNLSHVNTLRQSHGFAYGIKTKSNKLVIFHAQAIDGNWYFPSEVKEVPCGK